MVLYNSMTVLSEKVFFYLLDHIFKHDWNQPNSAIIGVITQRLSGGIGSLRDEKIMLCTRLDWFDLR